MTALKGELTRFLITRQIQCAIGGAVSNDARCIMFYVCVNITGKQAEFKLGRFGEKENMFGVT